MEETARGSDRATLTVDQPATERANWIVEWTVEKYREDLGELTEQRLADQGELWLPERKLWTPEYEAMLGGVQKEIYGHLVPYEVVEGKGNLLLNEGINLMWTLICGGAGTTFSNANAYLGVGDSTAAASASQTGLQGASTAYKAQDAGYPIYGSSQQVQFKSSFLTGEANFAWNEWTVCNSNSNAGTNMNRKQEALGTKSSGTWTLTITITLA